ncbi:sigma-54-dependent Fis family transcriptional regulator [Sphingomonas sp. HMWF008]|nr:sigma-54-dependent Fis family transcriptional regulator [Sphingomonas sp. HMWF008]
MNTDDRLSSGLGRVLFIDDDSIILKATELLLLRHGIEMRSAAGIADARAILGAEKFDVVLVDLNFSRGAVTGAEGLALISELIAGDPHRVLIVVTAHSGIAIAVRAMRLGATDFITKPWRNSRLLQAVQEGVAMARQRRSGAVGEPDRGSLPPILGASAATVAVRGLIERAAPTDAAVLIHGPPGSGKALVAAHLHAASCQAGSPLVQLDLAQEQPEQIAERLRAKIAEATGSSLFLSGIEVLPATAVGALDQALNTDTRLLTASTRPLTELSSGQFAFRGLAYRLATIEIELSAIAARPLDIAPIADHYLRLFATRYGRTYAPLGAATLTRMQQHDWPGGIDQLIQVIQRAMALDQTIDDLLVGDTVSPPAPGNDPDYNLDRLERRAVESALARHDNNVARAARELGLTRAALYRRMEKHGL